MFAQTSSRRGFLKHLGFAAAALTVPPATAQEKRPNILLAIADDQCWPYASAYGCRTVNTPAFDRVALEGILVNNCFTAAPQCSPTRAALLTGKNIWQIEEAGVHASNFPKHLKVYPELLAAAGYDTGYTGKPWGPGNWEISGRTQNPAGPAFNNRTAKPPAKGMSSTDYAANFEDFLKARTPGQPFCFWYGGHEPHLGYEEGSGLRAGKKLEDALVPGFLPDNEIVRGDILDYALEIEWFDTHLGRILAALEAIGELDNTLIVVTSDNGMPFPHAKANNYEHGTHEPMAIRWGDVVKPGRVIDDLIGFVDLAPTFLDAAGLEPEPDMAGRSLMNVLRSPASGQVDPARDRVYTGRERHTHARPDNLAYPCRAVRTHEFLYIWNMKPDRWPAGDPDGYFDIDGSPTKSYVLEHEDEYFDWATAKRPAAELYDIRNDPYCLKNLAGNPEYADVAKKLQDDLEKKLKEQGDPRALGYGDIFESYPRYSSMRDFEGFKARGEYNPYYQRKAAEEKAKVLGK